MRAPIRFAGLFGAWCGLTCATGCSNPPAAVVTSIAPVVAAPPVPPAAPGAGVVVDARVVGRIALLQLELPAAGVVVGQEFDGIQFTRPVSTLRMGESGRYEWTRASIEAANAVMRSLGFTVNDPIAPSGDATEMRGVRFALSGTMSALSIRAEARADLRAQANVTIDWQLLDFASASLVFEGRTMARSAPMDSLGDAVSQAVGRATERLFEEPAFRRALSAPSAVGASGMMFAQFNRAYPGPNDTLLVEAAPSVLSEAASALAGSVAIHGVRRFRTTGIVLDGLGLALTDTSVAHQSFLWAQLSDGSRRAVRLLRTAGDLALVELACEVSCPTVAWKAPLTLTDRAPVYVVVPISGGIWHQPTSLRVRSRGGEQVWSVRLRGKRRGGEAIVAASDGFVIGIATPNRVVPLGQALRSLRVTVLPF